MESERSFLRDVGRFFSHLFPEAVGRLVPSSLHRRLRMLRRFILPELVGNLESLVVDSTLLEVLHPNQVGQSEGFEGFAWVRWGSLSVYGIKLHLMCAVNGVPVSYELTPANVAEVRLAEELLAEACLEEVGRRLLVDLAYRSEKVEEALTECGVLLVTEKVDQRGQRQRIEICFSSLKRVFGLGEISNYERVSDSLSGS